MAQPKLEKTLQRAYRLRVAVPGAKSIEVTFPYEVVEREARIMGMEVEEFIRTHQVVAHFDAFDGVLYRFEKIKQRELTRCRREKEEAKGGPDE